MEPRSLLNKETYETVTGPDGYVYAGMADVVQEGLREMWAPETAKRRKKELQDWDKRIRLAVQLGQAAVPNPPICREIQEAKLRAKPVAVSQGGAGWGGAARPVGHRQGEQQKFSGWAGVAGVAEPVSMTPAQRGRSATHTTHPTEKTKKQGGGVPGAAVEKSEQKPKVKQEKAEKPAKPADTAEKAEKPRGTDEDLDPSKADFTKKAYPDTAKALRNIGKKLKEVEKIKDDGAKNDAQKAKVLRLPILRKEQQYIQVPKSPHSQDRTHVLSQFLHTFHTYPYRALSTGRSPRSEVLSR